LAALWGGSASQAVRREVPYFSEATRLFFLSPHLLTELSDSRLKQPYREHVWVYACINAIAQSISGIPLLFKTGTRKDPKVVESHRLVDLFESPNPMMSGSQLIEATFVYLGLTGEAFYIAERKSEREIPKELWVFQPHRFKEVVDAKTGLITGWLYSRGEKKVPLELHEVVFFRYFNPYHDYRGLAPLQAARAGIEQDYWAGKYNTAFFKNSAQPGGVLETSGNVPWGALSAVLEHTDLVLFDVKHASGDEHLALTGARNEQILDNLRRVSEVAAAPGAETGAAGLIVRVPIVPGFNDQPDHICVLAALLGGLPRVVPPILRK